MIELSAPYLVRCAPRPIERVVLATGEAPDPTWQAHFEKQLPGTKLQIIVEPAFRYLSEQRGGPKRIRARIMRGLQRLFAAENPESVLVWAHNLGVARNLILAQELGSYCSRHGLPLLAHHHDWWFDNRWVRWPEMRAAGFRTLASAARAVFPVSNNIRHAAINQADAEILKRNFGEAGACIPNLSPATPPINPAAAKRARTWLREKLGSGKAPVWVLPCRTLRRKNIAEALLLTRWLRPEAFLVITGGPSSADETPYARALAQAARRHKWRFFLGALAGKEEGQPSVAELLAASEAVLLTSIQEGFGLPYLEAAAARRPLIARRLPNIAPDLHTFGFRFPQQYDEILVSPDLFDWQAERQRQQRLLIKWRATLPRSIHSSDLKPALLAAGSPAPVPFSRLTLTAQLETLAQPLNTSWEACAVLNPFLRRWKQEASTQSLQPVEWPESASHWLSGEAYAAQFFKAMAPNPPRKDATDVPQQTQREFMAAKLAPANLYPLLWAKG